MPIGVRTSSRPVTQAAVTPRFSRGFLLACVYGALIVGIVIGRGTVSTDGRDVFGGTPAAVAERQE